MVHYILRLYYTLLNHFVFDYLLLDHFIFEYIIPHLLVIYITQLQSIQSTLRQLLTGG